MDKTYKDEEIDKLNAAQPLDFADVACKKSYSKPPNPDSIIVWGRGPGGVLYQIHVPPDAVRESLMTLDGMQVSVSHS